MSRFKIATGVAAMISLSTVTAIRLMPAPAEPIRLQATEASPLAKSDRESVRAILLAAGPNPAVTERIPAPDASAVVPPVLLVEDEDKPVRGRGRPTGADICAKHAMHKVYINHGSSWRCRK